MSNGSTRELLCREIIADLLARDRGPEGSLTAARHHRTPCRCHGLLHSIYDEKKDGRSDMTNDMRHSHPRQQQAHLRDETQPGGPHHPAASRKGSEQQMHDRLGPELNGGTRAYQKEHRRFGGAAICAAGLAVAVVAGSVGAAVALAVQANDSTVSIAATAWAALSQPTSSLPAGSIERVAASVVPSVVRLQTDLDGQAQLGSGIILTADGLIMTNAHVVAAAGAGPAGAGSAPAFVTLADERTAPFSVVASDLTSDVAVIRAQGVSGLTPIALGASSNLRVGQQVVAVGCPLGLDGTVTSGVISALHRQVSTVLDSADRAMALDTIQTDAPINPGNSGGALVDMNGQLIGMTSANATLGDSRDAPGGSIGIGFAIPVDQAKRVADQLIATGQASHPSLGAHAGTDGTPLAPGSR